ncbi:hypothetical protein [Microlunatus soli]|uniref:Uncharacterized protein n=1 Tax=Microlunatus soli TaxID=630515 RepID=A0A1H1QGU2_9ACTN|nr:hypothetical protein [Microlunatus soli]SDS22533.1 hypothetical protein SAMN04489812_1262 [Microlunatus soli]
MPTDNTPSSPAVTERASYQAVLDSLRTEEKAHTRSAYGRPTAQWPRLHAGRSDDIDA